MKKIFLALLLLFCAAGFAQAEKDALIKQDSLLLDKQFRFMLYLHDSAAPGLGNNDAGRKKHDNEVGYYFKKPVLKDNPYPDINIQEYLGFGTSGPTTWDEYMEAVYTKNFESLMAIIQKYGYPSFKRYKIVQANGGSTDVVTFALQTTKEQRKLFQKLLKKEYKAGNIGKKEYDMTKFLTATNGMNSEEFQKHIEKNGDIRIKTNQ